MQTYAKVVEPGERLTEKKRLNWSISNSLILDRYFQKKEQLYLTKKCSTNITKEMKKGNIFNSRICLQASAGLEWADGAKLFSKQK